MAGFTWLFLMQNWTRNWKFQREHINIFSGADSVPIFQAENVRVHLQKSPPEQLVQIFLHRFCSADLLRKICCRSATCEHTLKRLPSSSLMGTVRKMGCKMFLMGSVFLRSCGSISQSVSLEYFLDILWHKYFMFYEL